MIKSFEGSRGVAALLVALFHLKLFAPQLALIRNGYLLVDLFFVMSGFLMCLLYSQKLERPGAMPPFLLRRFGRLFPLLVFASVAYVLVLNLKSALRNLAMAHGYLASHGTPAMLAQDWPTWGEVASTLTLTHGMGLFDHLILNPVSWSISVEFYAYVLFATLCLLFRARLRTAAFLLFAIVAGALLAWAGVVWRDCLAAGRCLDVTYDFGYARCVAGFMLGALMVHLRLYLDRCGARLRDGMDSAPVQLALLALPGAGLLLVEAWPALGFAFPALFALLILSLCRDRGPLSRLLAGRPFQLLGERSYSVYMLHPVLLLLMEPLLRRDHGVAASVAMMAGYVVLLVWLSGHTLAWIEQPCRDWFNGLLMRRRNKLQALP
ncbi:acyltransferase family protein [Janthinobacterium psychrotolerans]|uniref:Peptidoglycan/LPS O-acetylase OafA/YrhL n=1 Tax=Janthinobacterium psychrotolerans TaxID=1747903 RepID=A0A1A7C4Q3_9BURK|nr:acyltransferase [Janthinobacterium psychrotolerans]OBV40672.1 Peptidoglycan/LPS O-acetylase OafA/YrhL [Janthinobacterium psychrotolerans]